MRVPQECCGACMGTALGCWSQFLGCPAADSDSLAGTLVLPGQLPLWQQEAWFPVLGSKGVCVSGATEPRDTEASGLWAQWCHLRFASSTGMELRPSHRAASPPCSWRVFSVADWLRLSVLLAHPTGGMLGWGLIYCTQLRSGFPAPFLCLCGTYFWLEPSVVV